MGTSCHYKDWRFVSLKQQMAVYGVNKLACFNRVARHQWAESVCKQNCTLMGVSSVSWSSGASRWTCSVGRFLGITAIILSTNRSLARSSNWPSTVKEFQALASGSRCCASVSHVTIMVWPTVAGVSFNLLPHWAILFGCLIHRRRDSQ